ncbi:MAG: cell division protein FtsA [Candidatus Omnitrophica bacterium]|nr:cell division protein FtsA [Candidatus Omnitrophota bacterium]MDD5653055.1 cell division protein FtsA [Candidatus Omnitrophota bacterium]
MLNNYICALDIGSSKLVAALARTKKGVISDIIFETEISKGIAEGSIVDSVELIGSLSRLLKNLKAKSEIKIKSLYLNVSGQDIATKHAHAIIPLAERGNKVVTLSDLQKVNEQARVLGSSLEEEIIHQIPYSYSIDSKSNISNPLGLYSHKLEVDLYLVCAKVSSLQSFSRVVNQAGYELKDLFLSGISTAYAVLNPGLKTGEAVICDIGSDITEIIFLKDAAVRNIEVLRTGGNAITQAIARELVVPFDLAEDVKRSYASVGDFDAIPQEKEILIKKDKVYKPIKQRLAAQTATSHAREICEKIKHAVEKHIALNEIDNFVVCGRTVLLEGFLEMLEGHMGIPVKLGKVNHPEIAPFINKEDFLSGHKYLAYLTSLGMIYRALHDDDEPQLARLETPAQNPLKKAISRVKEVYQEYF